MGEEGLDSTSEIRVAIGIYLFHIYIRPLWKESENAILLLYYTYYTTAMRFNTLRT